MTSAPFKIIALDGGAASGKTSTARALAQALNFLHVDTGLHYRALTRACLREGLPARDDPALQAFLQELRLGTVVAGHLAHLIINGEHLNESELRGAVVTQVVSAYAALPSLRQRLLAYQRGQAEIARQAGFGGLIMDGRDIGTVIFPEADLKVFLEAEAGARTARRLREGQSESIVERDRFDSSRLTAPLQPAPDAVHIDNTSVPLEEVVARIIGLLGGK